MDRKRVRSVGSQDCVPDIGERLDTGTWSRLPQMMSDQVIIGDKRILTIGNYTLKNFENF